MADEATTRCEQRGLRVLDPDVHDHWHRDEAGPLEATAEPTNGGDDLMNETCAQCQICPCTCDSPCDHNCECFAGENQHPEMDLARTTSTLQ